MKVPAVSRQLQVIADRGAGRRRSRAQPGRFLLKAVDANGRAGARAVQRRRHRRSRVRREGRRHARSAAVFLPAHLQPRRHAVLARLLLRRLLGQSSSCMLAMRRRPYSLADFKSDKPAQPTVRKDFPDAIYWIGDSSPTRRAKRASQVTYPDALTTWRLTARGVTADTRVGAAIGAHDGHERSDRARDHAAIPRRRATRSVCRSSPTTTCRATRRSPSA